MAKILISISDEDLAEVKEYGIRHFSSLAKAIQNGIVLTDNATNGEIYKAVFGYEPETDELICNKGMLCYTSPQCDYCSCKPDHQYVKQD